MSSSANKDVIRRFITEIWNGNDLKALDTFLDPAYYDYTYEPRNRDGLERALLLMQTAFPGHETIIEEIVSEGDMVAVCLTLRGTHAVHCLTKIFLCRSPFVFLSLASSDAATRIQGCC